MNAGYVMQEVIKYSEPSPATYNFIGKCLEAIDPFIGKYTVDNERMTNALIDALSNLAHLLDDRGDPTPEAAFDMVGFGHFKEVYEFIPRIVIKFAAERNPTEDEIRITEAANDADLGHVFLPTVYIPLPRTIRSAQLEPDDYVEEIYNYETFTWEPNPNAGNPRLNYVEFQVLGQAMCDDYSDPLPVFNTINHEAFKASGLTMWKGRPLDYDKIKDLPNPPIDWVKHFLTIYGLDELYRFSKFCGDNAIWDLHDNNVGFARLTPTGDIAPVVLDWMSH